MRSVRGLSNLKQETVATSGPKIEVFKDTGSESASAFPEQDSKWNDIGSLEFRRKENVAVERMAGATFPQTDKPLESAQNIRVFKDQVPLAL